MDSPLGYYMYEMRWRGLYMASGYGYALCMAWWYREVYVYAYGSLCRRLNLPLLSLDMGESLGVYIHITVYIACLFWLCLCLYHVWCFMAPGLYAHEAAMWWSTWRQWLMYVVCLYLVGLHYVWPEVGSYLLTLSPQHDIWGQGMLQYPRAHSYMYWALYTPLMVVLCGCIPYGLVIYGPRTMAVSRLTAWRYVWIWCSCVGVSLVVPPSPVFQGVLTGALWALYECTLMYLCVRVSHPRVKRSMS